METENPVLELAKEMGYNPEFDGEGKKSPEEFIKRGSTIQRNQNGKIKDLMKTMDGMSSEFVSMQKTFLETTEANERKHKADLETQRQTLETKLDDAVGESDAKEVKKIRSEIKELDKQETKLPKDEVNVDQAYFNEWAKDRKWIEADKKTQAAFRKAQIDVQVEHGMGNSAEFELTAIDKILKEKYPVEYGLRAKETPPGGDVGEGKSDTKTSKEVKLSTLSTAEEKMFNGMKRAQGNKFDEKSTLKAIGAVRASKEKK